MLGADLAGEVSTPASYLVEPEGLQRFTVAALDLGIKTNTSRNFARRGIRSHVLPASATFEQIAEIKPDGVFLSNGPGDPATADHIVALTREVLGAGMPLFGICSAIRSSAGRWACRPTRWSSATAGSTSRSSTTPPAESR